MDGFFCKNFDYFPYCFGPLGAKKNRLRRHLYTFSRLYVDCGTSSIVLETTTSKCGLSATDETGSEYFRHMVDDLDIYRRRRRFFFCNVGHRNRDL